LLAWAQPQALPQRQPPWQLQRSPQVQRSALALALALAQPQEFSQRQGF